MEKAKEQNGEQIWVGPSTGGTKHIASLKIWEAYGVEGNYVPFESGPMAMNALLGGQGAAGSYGTQLWPAKSACPSIPTPPPLANWDIPSWTA